MEAEWQSLPEEERRRRVWALIQQKEAEQIVQETAFWKGANAAYALSRMAEEAARAETAAHEYHRRLKSTRKLMATCQECGGKRVRWMAAQPLSSHIGRNGQRLARIYGLTNNKEDKVEPE